MCNKFLLYISISLFICNYSSDQQRQQYLSQEDLDELQRAEYHKRRLGLPTPASWGQFQTETPLECAKLTYLEEWLDDSLKTQNQLWRLDGYLVWLENIQPLEWENLLKKERLERLKLQRDLAIKNRSEPMQSFNVTNRQVIGAKVVADESFKL